MYQPNNISATSVALRNFSILLFLILTTQLSAQTVKVFIIAGQSNAEGQGQIDPVATNGTLAHFMANGGNDNFTQIQNPDGSWASRDDVWIRYDHGGAGDEDRGTLTGSLNVGYGEWDGAIGPELGFGQIMGDFYNEQVLIIKTCWGGKNLAVDFRPPSAGGITGPFYTQMIADINTAISNIAMEFPEYSGQGIEIAGFCWFQGWNDGETDAYLNEYEDNLKHLIADVRTDLNQPNLPFVLGLTGNGGNQLANDGSWVFGLQTVLVPAQISVATSPELDKVTYADTRSFWPNEELSPEPSFIHHWCNNAESFLRIGNEMGIKMVEMLQSINTTTTETALEAPIRLYPSPTQRSFKIHGHVGLCSLRIWDTSGRVVRQFQRVFIDQEINIANLKAGLYFVEIQDQEGKRMAMERIIKQ